MLEQTNAQPADREKIKRLMLDWRGRTLAAVESLLGDFLLSADRLLLEYAEKAESGAVQSHFYTGQRELWRAQDQVAELFHETLKRDLFEFTRPERATGDAPGAEVLSLVSKEDYELSLALQTITDQAIKQHSELYYALAQRLGVVAGTPPVANEKLPAGPHQLAKTFEIAIGPLAVERTVLLAFYTLFEREVIRRSPPWHEDLNEVLQKAGVLPHLRYKIQQQPGQGGPVRTRDAPTFRHYGTGAGRIGTGRGFRAAGADDDATANAERDAATGTNADADARRDGPAAGGNDAALGDQLLGRIRELLIARRRAQSEASGVPMRPDPVNPAPPATVAAVIDSPQVQQAVTFPETLLAPQADQRVVVSRELLEKLRSALSMQRSMIKRNVGHDKLSHFDEDTIDVVGMLFEQMLNDQRLGNTVKAVLSRMHTPYLKLAVRDPTLLRHSRHPARRLFDSLVEAGSHWVDEDDLSKGLFGRLQSIAEAVTHSEDPTQAFFERLESGLNADLERLGHRQQVREKRTVETERGQARLAEARHVATRSALEITEGRPGPAWYQHFVKGPWIDYLTLLQLRHSDPAGGDEWRAALDAGYRLQRLVDDFVEGHSPAEPALDALETELAQQMGAAIPHLQSEVVGLFAQFRADTGGTPLEDIQIETPAAPAAAAEIAAPTELSRSGQALLQRLPQLPQGSWVAFHHVDAPDQVVKLSWFNPKTERFLFVDRNGARALAITLPEFADRIDREQAHVLHDTAQSYVESSLQRALKALEQRA